MLSASEASCVRGAMLLTRESTPNNSDVLSAAKHLACTKTPSPRKRPAHKELARKFNLSRLSLEIKPQRELSHAVTTGIAVGRL